ncbi:hypothetical protein ZWY2020_040128 [Hordeum vulgare]|nr:hypothetical protein ZWY2020_040128 [Hordeum vulgare]
MIGGLRSSFSLDAPCSTVLILRLDLSTMEWDEAGRMLPNMYRCFTGLYEAAAQRSAMLPAPVAGGNNKVKVFGGDGKVWFGGKRVRGKLAMWEEDDVGSSGDKWDWVDGVSGYGDDIPDRNLNLVTNNFVVDSSSKSLLPKGWGCLQRNTPCFLGSPHYLLRNARMSPSSLRYFGIGLENGNYAVTLQFAEFDFPDGQTWKSNTEKGF